MGVGLGSSTSVVHSSPNTESPYKRCLGVGFRCLQRAKQTLLTLQLLKQPVLTRLVRYSAHPAGRSITRFTPHLSLGQWRSQAAVVGAVQQYSASWRPVEFEAGGVALISRKVGRRLGRRTLGRCHWLKFVLLDWQSKELVLPGQLARPAKASHTLQDGFTC